MSKTYAHSQLTGNPIEIEWFKSAERHGIPAMRYEVLVHTRQGEPKIGTIVTSLKLEAYCQEHGLILGCVHAKRPARPGDETELL